MDEVHYPQAQQRGGLAEETPPERAAPSTYLTERLL